MFIIAVAVAGILSSCASSRTPAHEPARDLNDTLAFSKLGKGVFFGVNAILRSDTSIILVSNQDVFRTSNNGASWESLAEPLPHKNITAVEAINDTIYAGSGHGTVYKSTDHGLQWKVHHRTNMGTIRGFSRTAEPLAFDNPSAHVWPCPTLTLTQVDSTLVQTSPFGVARSFTWKSFQGARARIASDSRIIFTSGDADIIVYNLDDERADTITAKLLQGQTASSLALWYDTLFVGTKLALGGVFRIRLGQQQWEQMLIDRIEGALDVNTLTVNDRAVYVASREHGVLVVPHRSNIIRSISDGIHFALHQSITRYRDSWVVSSRVKGALAFDANGANLRVLSTNAPTSPEYIVSALGTTLVMGLADGSVYLSRDDGRTWDFRSKRFEQSEITNFRVIDGELYASSVSGLYKSTDTARSFSRVTDALKDENVQSAVKTDSMLIIFASTGTYTLRNNGRLDLFAPNVKADYQVRLNDAIVHNGVVLGAGYPGLFVSHDAGLTWSLTTIPKAMVLRTVYCDATSVYVVGDDGDIYVSRKPSWLQGTRTN